MPPKGKKKKPAANPARGFATISVPSKPKPDEVSTTENAVPAEAPPENRRAAAVAEEQQKNNRKEDDSQYQYSPEEIERHLEESELQLLVEKYGAKCKYDAGRQAARLETDRRVMRQQAIPLNVSEWIPSDMLHQILQLAEAEEAEQNLLLLLLLLARGLVCQDMDAEGDTFEVGLFRTSD